MPRRLILVAGESVSGKSTSLMNLKDPQGVFYLNTESGKELPFNDKFRKTSEPLSNPNDIFHVFEQIEAIDSIHTVVVDSLTFLMDMYESVNVLPAANTMKAWGDYAQFYKRLMQTTVAKSKKNWVFLAHNFAEPMNSGDHKYYVPVKGALAKNGIESYFTNVVYAKRMKLADVLKHDIDENLLTVTPRDEAVGYKHVFQCEVTKDMAHSRIRSPVGCFNPNQTFMDNDVQKLIDHLDAYYT